MNSSKQITKWQVYWIRLRCLVPFRKWSVGACGRRCKLCGKGQLLYDEAAYGNAWNSNCSFETVRGDEKNCIWKRGQ